MEHIKELVDSGYLIEEWRINSSGRRSKGMKYYKINFSDFNLVK